MCARNFSGASGFDPIELFGSAQGRRIAQAFLDFRAELARRMQEEWLAEMEGAARDQKPHLDLVLTHVDDRFDTGMRDAIGADAARVLPLLDTAQLHVPDRGSGHGLEPGAAALPGDRGAVPRADAASRAAGHRYRTSSIGIRMFIPPSNKPARNCSNWCIMPRANFARVALYFENSLLAPDLSLAAFGCGGSDALRAPSERRWWIESSTEVGVPWHGPAMVDGMPWPAADGSTLWLPAGSHSIEPGAVPAAPALLRLSGGLKSARVLGAGRIELLVLIPLPEPSPFWTRSPSLSRWMAWPAKIRSTPVLFLPRGQHVVTISAN